MKKLNKLLAISSMVILASGCTNLPDNNQQESLIEDYKVYHDVNNQTNNNNILYHLTYTVADENDLEVEYIIDYNITESDCYEYYDSVYKINKKEAEKYGCILATIDTVTYRPCQYEDSYNCVWLASKQGNKEGLSFIDIDGSRFFFQD